ncbi:18594_t:CDS:1, partial [Rhizophagus irregularis]
ESGGDKKERESEGEEAAAEIEIQDDFNSKEAAAEIEVQNDSDSKEVVAEIEIWDDSDSDIDEDLEHQLLDLFCKRYKKTGETDSNKDEELECNLIHEIR